MQTAPQTVSLRLIEQRAFGNIEYYHRESRHLTVDESQSTKALDSQDLIYDDSLVVRNFVKIFIMLSR